MENSGEDYETARSAVEKLMMNTASVSPIEGEPTAFWWVSFAAEKFLGVVIAETRMNADVGGIARECWKCGCNPGGEVMAFKFDPVKLVGEAAIWFSTAPRWKLLQRDDLPTDLKRAAR